MKNTFIKFAGAVAVLIALVQSLQATQISGTIGFTGRVALNTGSASTAKQVVGWVNPTVNGASGDFLPYVNTGTATTLGSSVTIFSPWSFNSGAIAAFWKVGGFTFDLTSSKIEAQGGIAGLTGFVNVSGIGTISGNGFNVTSIIWNFSSQDPAIIGNPDSFTFSASHVTVPDGASTIALLGLALTSAGLLRKKLAA